MINQQIAQALHDKATRGRLLSMEEQSLLEAWYALQDQEESRQLGDSSDEKTVTGLHAQISATLTQLATLAQRLQDITAENDRLKQENSLLRRQLAYQPTAMPIAA